MTLLKRIELHSFHIILLLLFVLTFGSVGIGLFIQSNPLILAFDNYLYNLVHNGMHSALLDSIVYPFNFNFLPVLPGNLPSFLYFYVLFALTYLLIFKRSLLKWAIFCCIFGQFLAFVITAIDWQFVFRERPFLSLPHNVDPRGISAWEKLSSYPSGHVRETALYSTIIARFIPQIKWFLAIFVIFIAWSRIYLGAHFPTDTIAGIAIGYLSAKTILVIAREIQIILNRRKGQSHEEAPKPDSSDISQG